MNFTMGLNLLHLFFIFNFFFFLLIGCFLLTRRGIITKSFYSNIFFVIYISFFCFIYVIGVLHNGRSSEYISNIIITALSYVVYIVIVFRNSKDLNFFNIDYNDLYLDVIHVLNSKSLAYVESKEKIIIPKLDTSIKFYKGGKVFDEISVKFTGENRVLLINEIYNELRPKILLYKAKKISFYGLIYLLVSFCFLIGLYLFF